MARTKEVEAEETDVSTLDAIMAMEGDSIPMPEGFELNGTYYINPTELTVDYTQNGRRFGVKPEKVANLREDFLNPEIGQLQEVGIFWNPKAGSFQVVFGYHRAAAAIAISVDGVGPDEGGVFLLRCYVMSIEDAARAMGINLAENSAKNRSELTPMDKAYTVTRMLENGYKLADIAARMGVSKALVGQLRHLVEFPLKVQKAIDRGIITQSGAFELIEFKDNPEVMQTKVDEIVAVGGTINTAAVRAIRRERVEEATEAAETAEANGEEAPVAEKPVKAGKTMRTLKEILGFLRDFSDCEKDVEATATQQVLKVVLKYAEGRLREKAASKAIDKILGVVVE